MKKGLALVLLALCLFLGAIYIFIPSNIVISKVTTIGCTLGGAYRYLARDNNWGTFWKEKNDNAYGYIITGKLTNGAQILIKKNDFELPSTIELFAKDPDSVVLDWHCSMVSGINPVKRILRYSQAVDIKKNMDAITENLERFLDRPENVYGIKISRSSITDTLLVAARYDTPSYPTTREVYEFLKPVKEYIQSQAAHETGYPMLNISRLNGSLFQTMVAIPVNKDLAGKGAIFSRRMIPGNFMVAEITGGTFTINQALDQMQHYFDDYRKTSMAIPFQTMVTDRITQPDTSKWVTKIFAPVMN
jgi:hypothetical protein